jgi:hypothetical protein
MTAPGAAAPGAMNENEVLAWLRRTGTRRTVEGMARYGGPHVQSRLARL